MSPETVDDATTVARQWAEAFVAEVMSGSPDPGDVAWVAAWFEKQIVARDARKRGQARAIGVGEEFIRLSLADGTGDILVRIAKIIEVTEVKEWTTGGVDVQAIVMLATDMRVYTSTPFEDIVRELARVDDPIDDW